MKTAEQRYMDWLIAELEYTRHRVDELKKENAELRARLDKLEKAGEILQRDLLRVLSTSNERANELLANIWYMAKLQAEKELKGEKQ